MQPLLIVFSHVRWSAAGSRPQHLVSRLAGRWQVVYIEEPRPGPATLQHLHASSDLSVLVPLTPLDVAGFHDDQLGVMLPLLKRHLATLGRPPDAAWLTTPMALPLAQAFHPPRMVYDCMEPLAELAPAPRQIAQRERALLKQADLVFTAGPSLYSERQAHHPAVHCLPNAVDAAHFARGSTGGSTGSGRPAPVAPGSGRGPRLGFHGVIDERVDLALVAAVADARPHWTLVMAGPVHASVAARLPQRANLHWTGAPHYDELPGLFAGWDLAMMPFVLSAANRLANPLQTLEYLAADVPVVSTPLRDVEWLYGEAVSLAVPGAAGFVQACEQTLSESASARCRRSLAAMSIVATHSWDRSADTVHSLLLGSLDEQGRRDRAPLHLVSAERRA